MNPFRFTYEERFAALNPPTTPKETEHDDE